ncbi:hypothetical protein BKI49_18980 [Streptomyces sp. Tue6028]|uniref:hypothetical protein n=1 Tax=Streptomyces sp. Tue6028 TaxID=2036037 RepID=UPI000BB2EE63|nr:hypothetical protein [Streptomyces sp. Tue6028]PBC62339.1 hypothetical protein BKI49_18980 [Streptomyces sp. Tue6028]
MAQAAPVSPASGTPHTPDVFGERTHAIARWAVPAALGLVYGYWAAAITRYGGPITGWNVLFGFVCAIVFAALLMGVSRLAPLMKRELHAVVWGAFAGCAVGFLFSQSNASVLSSSLMGLVAGAAVFLGAFYRYYTHEDAAGHRVE